MDNLFSTHPATENRIAALDELARHMGQDSMGGGTGPGGGWRQGRSGGLTGTPAAASGPWSRGRSGGPWG
jgi:heat shock protein HtpX